MNLAAVPDAVYVGLEPLDPRCLDLTRAGRAEKGAPAYVYRFSYVPAAMRGRGRNGVPHGTEIPYVFDTLGAGPGGQPAPQDQEVARMVNTYWANFVKTGDPNGPDLPKWPRHDPRKDQVF